MMVELSNIKVQLPGMNKVLFAIKKHTVAAGQRILIQGPSGKGKTTLLHLMAGLVDPNDGVVAVNGRALGSMSESERARFRRENFGIIFQKLNLVSHLTAFENIQLGLPAGADPVKIVNAMRKVSVAAQADVLAQSLSLGQAQRVAVARVLAQAPMLVLADEPTSSLDDENAFAVIRALFELRSETTLIVVSHDHRIREHFKDVRDFESLVKN